MPCSSVGGNKKAKYELTSALSNADNGSIARSNTNIARQVCILFVTLSILSICSSARADNLPCNIPVFRFALERWQPDAYEIVILKKGQTNTADQTVIEELAQFAKQNPNCCRISEYSLDDGQIKHEEISRLAANLKPDSKFPQLIVRNKIGRGRIATPWQGAVADFNPEKYFNSPVRKELASRLIKGQSVVWLVVESSDLTVNSKLKDQLTSKLKKLEKEIPLPEGIGLPGSELYSSIPLNMKFSVLPVNRDDPKEQSLIELLKQFQPDAFAEDIPLVVPVFGKGRGLEVIPGDQLDNDLTEDLSIFLSGACSCQVKDLNPGFDLPIAVNWNLEIFGEDAVELPPEDGPGQQRGGKPELVPIAPGNSRKQSDK